MAQLNRKPVTGMRDILPQEMEIRNYCMRVIRETYESYGFTQVETPCVESLENLTSKQGGDNEKLIFRILKRGEKLHIDEAKTEEDLSDLGLRYDLTLPLSRFYAANQQALPQPFRAIQMGNVWRAERPQKGRFRQFMQCDIDILGEASNLAEIELITATTDALRRLSFKDFTVRVNDRKILRAMADFSGFPEEKFDEVCIILDKMDKIGKDGVAAELSGLGLSGDQVDRYMSLFDTVEEKDAAGNTGSQAVSELRKFAGRLGDALQASVTSNLSGIFEAVESAGNGGFTLEFDPTLVRGMGYYTGTIFEVSLPGYGGSCAGGGRYDGMIGRFTGNHVPACGFSIGFERIIMILTEQGFRIPDSPERIAFLIEKGMEADRLKAVMEEAGALRREGRQVLVSYMNKNRKFQKEQLAERGYNDIRDFYIKDLSEKE